MTDKEIENQAEGYSDNLDLVKERNPKLKTNDDFIKQAFQDGAKWGAEHAIEWHDLRKDPNDLPKESKWCWCKYPNDVYYTAIYDVKHRYWFSSGESHRVIAWCELPQFKE